MNEHLHPWWKDWEEKEHTVECTSEEKKTYELGLLSSINTLFSVMGKLFYTTKNSTSKGLNIHAELEAVCWAQVGTYQCGARQKWASGQL